MSEDKASMQLQIIQYDHELEPAYLDPIRELIAKDLSEPYSIYVYRYFLSQWKDLCFMVRDLFCNLSMDTYLIRNWVRIANS